MSESMVLNPAVGGDERAPTVNYRYRAGIWSEIELAWPEGEGPWSEKEIATARGFSSGYEITIGQEIGSLWARVYRRASLTAPGEFCVGLSTQLGGNDIICDRLPDLLALLGQLAPIIRTAMDTDRAEEKWTHGRDHARKNDRHCQFCQDREERAGR